MNRIKAFGAFWYDFVIGDDWHVAAMVVAGLALTAICVHVAGVNAWWLLPVFAFAALAWSLHRATKPSKQLPGPIKPLPHRHLFPHRHLLTALASLWVPPPSPGRPGAPSHPRASPGRPAQAACRSHHPQHPPLLFSLHTR
jgi:hypothetical protein